MADRLANIAKIQGILLKIHASSDQDIFKEATTSRDNHVNQETGNSYTEHYVLQGPH